MDNLYQICLKKCKRQDEQERLQQEWEVLETTNILPILEQFVRILPYIDGQWFVRGSAGCSLIIYLLGGSRFHPIDFDLSLERFTNIHRKTLGDIDIDVFPSRRPNIYKRIGKAFPRCVGRLSNRNTYKERSSRRKYLTNIQNIHSRRESSSYHWTREDLDAAKIWEGTFSHYSLHVGGLCFWEKPIPSKYIFKSDQSPIPQLTLDKHDVQEKKLFKVDILNNHALEFVALIDPLFQLDSFTPEKCNHKEVWELIQRGDTMGVLYGESPMMKRCLQQIRPSNLLELALCFSLIRPMNRRVRHKLDKYPFYAEYIKQFHEPYFDDDWIRWLAKRHKLSLADADSLRRRLAKDPKELRIKGYGFCRSHALHYALLIYIQSYYKLHFPLEFYKVLLNQAPKQKRMYERWVYVIDAFSHHVYIQDCPTHKKTSLVIHKSSMSLRPEGGIQRRLFPLPLKEQIRQSKGLFATKKGMSLQVLDQWVACERKLSPNVSSIHVFDAKKGQFVDKIV